MLIIICCALLIYHYLQPRKIEPQLRRLLVVKPSADYHQLVQHTTPTKKVIVLRCIVFLSQVSSLKIINCYTTLTTMTNVTNTTKNTDPINNNTPRRSAGYRPPVNACWTWKNRQQPNNNVKIPNTINTSPKGFP